MFHWKKVDKKVGKRKFILPKRHIQLILNAILTEQESFSKSPHQPNSLSLVVLDMNLFQQAKSELFRSNADKKHPFRYCQLSTLSEYPETRTVINRKIGLDFSVLIYTDSRTPKVQHIQTNNKVSALFYHPKKRLQIRVKGLASIIGKEHPDYLTHLQQVNQSPSLRDYTTLQPPGSPLETENVVLGTVLYFTAILLEPLYLDILLLRREGHLRSDYFLEDGQWIERRLVP